MKYNEIQRHLNLLVKIICLLLCADLKILLQLFVQILAIIENNCMADFNKNLIVYYLSQYTLFQDLIQNTVCFPNFSESLPFLRLTFLLNFVLSV